MPRRAGAFSLIVLFASAAAGPACKKEELVDPGMCANEVADLRAWLAVISDEGDVAPETIVDPDDQHHYLSRPFPRVPVVRIDAHPSQVTIGSLLTLSAGTVTHDKHTANVLDQRSVDEIARLAASSVLSPEFGTGGLGYFYSYHPISMVIGANERWEDVVRVINAAIAQNVSPIDFVFGVQTRATRPDLDARSAARMVALATDAKEMPWRRDVALANELRRANPHCTGVAAPFAHEANDSTRMVEQRKIFMAQAANAVAGCGCRADIASIRAFAWTRHGRHWGDLKTTYELRVSPPGQVESIAAPKDATWQSVHARVLDAARRKVQVSFAAR